MEFVEVLFGVPLVAALGQKLLVVLVRVVDGIEQVLKVIETDQTDLVGLLLLGGGVVYLKAKSQNDECKEEILIHGLSVVCIMIRRQR